MALLKSLEAFGKYILFLSRAFSIPDKWHESAKRYVSEIYKLGIDSIALTIIISVFIGAVCCIQMQMQTSSPLLPRYTVGFATREIILLEFTSSILCLILSGKVGSNIASEIGTMRITEQIDALEIMGINSTSLLVAPKIVALVTYIPVLVIISMASALFGGYIVALCTDIIPVSTYLYGLQTEFVEWHVWYALIKSVIFAFIIGSISSYYGYNVKGGALDVGKASTDAVVTSSVMILLFDVILTKILL